MEYINREGNRYFAFQGVTKTGKPKFFVARKKNSDKGTRVEQLPPEYEFYEAPRRGRVCIRKRRSSAITLAEQNSLSRLVLELTKARFAIEVEKNRMILWAAPRPVWDEYTQKVMRANFRGHWPEAPLDPNFRFTLANQEKRLFTLEICDYREDDEPWFDLETEPMSLEAAALRFFSHIQEHSYFELFKKGITE